MRDEEEQKTLGILLIFWIIISLLEEAKSRPDSLHNKIMVLARRARTNVVSYADKAIADV